MNQLPLVGGIEPRFVKSSPDYLIVGVITRDIVAGGFVPGGTVTYAGMTARTLGQSVGVVTSAADDLRLDQILPGIDVRVSPSTLTTTFENVYHNGVRQQWLRSVAERIPVAAVPDHWRNAAICHLAPLAAEFGAEMAEAVRGSRLLGVTPQGWLRAWDQDGFVQKSRWANAEEILRLADVVILSQEDLDGGLAACAQLADRARILVATQGASGCTVFERGGMWPVAGFPTTEIDATGAGDVFAAAFLIQFSRTGDLIQAARFANCVASFSVEGIGVSSVPTPDAVERRLETSILSRSRGD